MSKFRRDLMPVGKDGGSPLRSKQSKAIENEDRGSRENSHSKFKWVQINGRWIKQNTSNACSTDQQQKAASDKTTTLNEKDPAELSLAERRALFDSNGEQESRFKSYTYDCLLEEELNGQVESSKEVCNELLFHCSLQGLADQRIVVFDGELPSPQNLVDSHVSDVVVISNVKYLPQAEFVALDDSDVPEDVQSDELFSDSSFLGRGSSEEKNDENFGSDFEEIDNGDPSDEWRQQTNHHAKLSENYDEVTSDPFQGQKIRHQSTPYPSRKILTNQAIDQSKNKKEKEHDVIANSKFTIDETGYQTLSESMELQPTAYQLIQKVYGTIDRNQSWTTVDQMKESNQKIPQLIIEIILEEDVITQTSRRLDECLSRVEGYNCKQVAEEERILLVSGQKVKMMTNEMCLMNLGVFNHYFGDQEDVILTNIVLPMRKEYLHSKGKYEEFFVCLAKCDGKIGASPIVCANDLCGNNMMVPGQIQLKMVHNDAAINFEIYHLLLRRPMDLRKQSFDIGAKMKKIFKRRRNKPSFKPVRNSNFQLCYSAIFHPQKLEFTILQAPPKSPMAGPIRMSFKQSCWI